MQYDKNSRSCWQLLIDRSFIMKTCPLMHHVLCRDFWQNIKSPRWLSPPVDQIWCPATSGISQEISEHQWDSGIYGETANGDSNKGFCSVLNSRRDSGRTDWGPKVPTLKGTEASLSYVQCFLYLVSSINVFIFHITWLDTLWTLCDTRYLSNWGKLPSHAFPVNNQVLLHRYICSFVSILRDFMP